jgi:hypothetical protein
MVASSFVCHVAPIQKRLPILLWFAVPSIVALLCWRRGEVSDAVSPSRAPRRSGIIACCNCSKQKSSICLSAAKAGVTLIKARKIATTPSTHRDFIFAHRPSFCGIRRHQFLGVVSANAVRQFDVSRLVLTLRQRITRPLPKVMPPQKARMSSLHTANIKRALSGGTPAGSPSGAVPLGGLFGFVTVAEVDGATGPGVFCPDVDGSTGASGTVAVDFAPAEAPPDTAFKAW